MTYKNTFKLIYTLLLTALLAGGSMKAMAQGSGSSTGVVVKGNVYGGGNQADVQVNTAVNMSTGRVEGNVYGGGNLGDVGTIDKTDNTNYNYTWTGNSPATESPSATIVSGLCTVEISGGTVGPTEGNGDADHGNVFGAGKGEATTFWCEKGIVYKAVVSISAGTVKRNVYGGGRIGRVENDTQVTIGDGTNSGVGSAELTYAPIIGGNVFGAGAGALTHGYSALVRNNSKVIVQGNAKVENSVYGGGEKATVGKYNIARSQTEADAHNVKIGMPYETVSGGECTVEILGHAKIGPDASGNVFGGGMGVDPTNDTYAYVTTGTDEEKKSSRPRRMTLKPDPLPANYIFDETDNARVVWEYFSDRDAYFVFLQTLALASNTDLTIKGNASVKGSVYGGSESGFIQDHTVVKIEGGTILTTGTDANGNLIGGNIFGGGKGLPVFSEAGKVKGNTNLTISEGTIAGSVYGGGELGDVGTITKNFTSYNYQWKKNDGNTDNDLHNNDISGTNTNTGICNVTISGGETTGNVFGAGKGKDDTWWCEKAMVFATNVSISGASTKVYGSVFGGGEIGRVEDDAKVTIGTSGGSDTPNITGSVFGAGKGLATHGYSALLRGNTEVTVQGGATVGQSVYGGGEIATVGRYVVVNGVPTEPDGGGDCTVTIKDNAVITENVFGAGQGVDPATYRATDNAVTGEKRSRRMMVYDPGRDYAGGPYEWEYITTYGTSYDGPKFVWEYFTEAQYRTFLETLALACDTEVEIGGTSGKTTKVNGSVYGGSESGFLQRHTQVTIQDNCEIGTTSGTTGGNVFGGGKGLAGYAAGGRVSGYTNVAISGGTTCTMYGSVYGGGENGIVKGGVNVNMAGGTVNHDVYGGGALADTNTGNGSDFIAVPEIPSNPKNAGLYEKEYVPPTESTALENVTYYEYKDSKYVVKSVTAGETSVSGLFVVEYNETEVETADANKAYYTQTHSTTVNLLGGTIKGDAYGGGLGQKTGFNSAGSDVEAVVWGDINVTLGKNDGSSATSFYITYDNAGTTEKPVDVVKSGRVFGCNNLLGSPKGDVTVTVWTTEDANGGTITKTDEENKNSTTPSDHTYRLAAVYGGGNLAPYTTEGKKAHVIIHGCSDTSILTVYGGGNAAAVPETDVDVYSAYEIGSLFGGGNGKDKYKNDSGWRFNPGANVNGNANTMIYGGTVHEAYGGSNEKGTITGDVVIDLGTNAAGETCTLDVAKLVGAGKNADVNGDLKIIMGCKPSETIPLVFGGADNANVNGNVELTITSGNFTKVFGGNNNGGFIKGHIILNIEETTCIPINIDYLYLCGNHASYSQYGYYVKTTENTGENATGVGASTEHAILTSAGKLDLIPRESADDTHLPVDTYSYSMNEITGDVVATWTTLPITGDGKFEGYAAPVLNVTSCTSIGEVFGGGFGEDATVYGNPTVNINMIPGDHASDIKRSGSSNAHDLGAIGDVYGGGDAAAVCGNTTVNIGTRQKVQLHESIDGEGNYTMSGDKNVEGAYITGDVYGGGKLADVGKTHLAKDSNNKDIDVIDIEGSTFVNIGAVKGSEILDAQSNGTGRYNYTSVSFTPADAPGIFIGGNVYGGGKGEAAEPVGTDALPGAFRCGKAMVTKNTNVAIGNGTIGDGNADHGHVYGGGEKGRVEENTSVTIGCENDANSKPVITGNVFGAGKGVNTHGYSALARGNSYVTVQGEAKVKKSVYGGGEIASVGKYNINAQGLPESLANQNSGYCTVIVRDNAVIGPDAAMVMTAPGYPDDKGHVFGGGKGVLPYEGYADNAKAWRVKIDNKKQEYLSKDEAIAGTADESTYLPYVETLGLATQTYVTIDENAFVKGSVYGGSENGYVQHDTQVNIRGNCQIGNGYVQMADDGTYLAPANMRGVNRRYTAKEWEEGHLFVTGDTEVDASDPTEAALRTDVSTNYTSSLPECASWPYGQATGADKYAPWDMYDGTSNYDSKGGRTTADDGHTFYGNVFGGGSGVIPYRPGQWHPEAGSVGGNTEVNITGGHILTNIYGGNELTDVYGKCTVNFGGTATLGVPRTLKQIAAHPLTCYLFGAGKGDQRVLFNKKTNVKDVEVNITGGWIYGSVFGGGEDGHVHHNVTMTINESDYAANNTNTRTKIGTWGTTYVDGNVFGGGRGFGADAYTAGNVAGTVTMTIESGTILGSIYGGGRLGSVGYGLFDEGAEGYGEMRPDGEGEASNPTPATNFKRGHVYMTIGKDDGSGPTIGNTWEYKIPSASNGPMTTGETPTPTLPTDISTWTTENWTTWREYNHVPKTEYEYNASKGYHMLTHTKGGNVFAGGMGNFYRQDGSTLISGVDWWKLGNVKSTTLTIKGCTIKSNVYGGGELGAVIPYTSGSTIQGGTTEIDIQGGTIGTVITEEVTTGTGESAQTNDEPRYTFGSVYGGGMGSEEGISTETTSIETKIGGRVEGSTKIDMKGGTVRASVYGGGELAVVQGSHTVKDIEDETKTVNVGTEINISAGTIGYDQDGFGGATMGNVYGAGKGSLNTPKAGLIMNNTRIKITGSPTIYHNIYGGGAYASVGTFTFDTNGPTITNETTGTGKAEVIIEGGTIGINGHENGMIFGSSRGDVAKPDATTEKDPNNKLAWVLDTHVVIGTKDSNTGPQIRGSVYGSGENGHVLNNTTVDIHSGTIGIDNDTQKAFDITSNGVTYNGAEYPSRGNVYGGGCGTDTYSITTDTGDDAGTKYYFNPTAGIVRGNATINMDGGKVVRAIYGGGAMGSIGKYHRKTATTTNLYVPEPMESCEPNTGLCTINISRGQVGPDNLKADLDAGNVFGAGRGEIHNTVEYPNLERLVYTNNTIVNVSGTADVKGSVYGGGETGNVLNNTEVNVCAQKQTDGTYAVSTASGTPTIGGNVFGGGKGVANSFTCSSAMVGLEGDGVTITGTSPNETYTLKDGGTTVRIYNGTVGTLEGATGSQTLKAGTGNVYGGGEIARVERNTVVEIGAATGSSSPTIQGSVFAAGAGKATHGYSALVRGHSTVTVQGSAQVLENVYGGGELASVGRYKVKTPANTNPNNAEYDSTIPTTLPYGMPARLLAGGTSTVNILGSATIGTAGNDETGHVYGAGQGLVPSYAYNNKDYTSETPYATRIMSSKRMVAYTSAEAHPDTKQYKEWDYYVDDEGNQDTRYVWEYFPTKDAYLQFVETLALSAETFVTIGGKRDEATGNVTTSGTPTVKGTVFGGSESGFVYKNTDVKIQGGIVNGDAFGGGLGLESFAEAGRVRWNTNLAVSGGAVQGNVYGGGKLGDVGTIYKEAGSYDYIWRNSLSNGNNLDTDAAHQNRLGNNTITGTNTNTGICTVSIKGGTIGLSSTDEPSRHGNVFGAGKGKEITWWCEKAIAYATNVSVTDGTVYGTVYGGGEVGRVEDDAKVTIGTSGESGANKPNITGSVFGGGAGLATHGYSALVRGDAKVTVQGAAKVGGNVYGGGEIASVGRFKVDKGLPTRPKGGGTCSVIVKDNAVTGDVYGSCKGVDPATISAANRKSMQLFDNRPKDASGNYKELNDGWYYYEPNHDFVWVTYTEDTYPGFLATLGLASNTHVTIGEKNAQTNPSIMGSVYGGGQRGVTLGGVDVNITGGTVGTVLQDGTLKVGTGDVYGGGALANTNSSHWHEGQRTEYVKLVELYKGIPVKGYYTKSGDTYTLVNEGTATGADGEEYYAIFKTNVNLKGGTVRGSVYGGGLGQLESGTKGQPGYVSPIEAKVYGDVLVNLNEPTTSGTSITYGDCEVKGRIFGCNNLNGSPQNDVTVHVYKTVTKSGTTVQAKPAKDANTYELEAVYGGGNLAAFYPDDETARGTAKANVIIDGCDLTSIQSVYGGGNAASAPATEVTVNGTYEIGEVFGGGNGKDSYQIDGKTYENPGANVGYKSYAYHTWNATPAPGQYVVSEYTSTDGADKDASTKEKREANYAYGTGKTQVSIYGGTVHAVYGGSNSKGNVREAAVALLDGEAVDESDDAYCPFDVDEAYGGGKNADMDGTATLIMSCINGLSEVYGGAKDADVNSDVSLTITNGTYGQVFGGNNVGGRISGAITVNIKETGCKPVIIGELYGGGNKACYSIYGYKDSGNKNEDGKTIWLPFKAGDAASTVGGVTYTPQTEATKYGNPVVNVHSFTSIGTIYGGGYGETAVMVGSPTVNVDVYEGRYYNDTKSVINPNAKVVGAAVKYSGTGYDKGYPIPTHTKGDIGAINTIFGGGNAAEVVGNTTVNIGTHTGEELDEYEKVPDEDITVGTTDVSSYYTYSPASYTAASGTAVEGTTYYHKTGDVYSVVEIAAGSEIGADCYTLTSEAGYTAATGKAAADTTYYWKKTVKGADIRGNVYGGGNNAPVTGDTNVVIGKQATE